MPVIINQTDDRVLLRFNSGVTYTLGPREELEVEHVELKGNERIRHLEERRRVAIERGGEAREGARARGRRAPAARGATEKGGRGEAAEEAAEEGGGTEERGGRRPLLRRRKGKAEE